MTIARHSMIQSNHDAAWLSLSIDNCALWSAVTRLEWWSRWHPSWRAHGPERLTHIGQSFVLTGPCEQTRCEVSGIWSPNYLQWGSRIGGAADGAADWWTELGMLPEGDRTLTFVRVGARVTPAAAPGRVPSARSLIRTLRATLERTPKA